MPSNQWECCNPLIPKLPKITVISVTKIEKWSKMIKFLNYKSTLISKVFSFWKMVMKQQSKMKSMILNKTRSIRLKDNKKLKIQTAWFMILPWLKKLWEINSTTMIDNVKLWITLLELKVSYFKLGVSTEAPVSIQFSFEVN